MPRLTSKREKKSNALSGSVLKSLFAAEKIRHLNGNFSSGCIPTRIWIFCSKRSRISKIQSDTKLCLFFKFFCQKIREFSSLQLILRRNSKKIWIFLHFRKFPLKMKKISLLQYTFPTIPMTSLTFPLLFLNRQSSTLNNHIKIHTVGCALKTKQNFVNRRLISTRVHPFQVSVIKNSLWLLYKLESWPSHAVNS